MEAFIVGLIAIVGLSFLTEIILAKPNLGEVAGGLIPRLPGKDALYIAIGIIGATVMPHNLYLHSALVQTRKIHKGDQFIKRALKLNFLDSAIALNLAFLVNAAILILAATVFFKTGRTEVAQLKQAYQLLPSALGTSFASYFFAIALIAAGQSSTLTGTLAGQIVMEGYLQLRINPWLRRLLTRLLAIIPALIIILIYGEDRVDDLIIFSQVVLSVQLGFAMVPLIHFVSDKKLMGNFSIGWMTKLLSWMVAFLLIYLNFKLVLNAESDYLATPGNWVLKGLIVVVLILAVLLLLYVMLHPWISRRQQRASILLHPQPVPLVDFQVPVFMDIAVALDFSERDDKLLSFAIGQGNTQTKYILIHVVESASALMLGHESDDYETRKDEERLDFYRARLAERGLQSKARLGYRNRTGEIVRIVKEEKADMLVIGAHGHGRIKDFIYGQTVNTVRHELKIPVLIVNI